MRKLKHLIEYALVRFLETLVDLPPLPMAIRIGEALGMTLKRLLPGRDRLILSNLAYAFPEKTPEERRRIADGVWRNIGRVAVEFIRSDEIVSPETVTIENREVVDRAIAAGKGVVLLTSHFCNWEYAGIITHRFLHPVVAIARPMRNPYVEAWVRRKRSSTGLPVILHRQAVKESLRLVRQGGMLGMLADQNLYKGGVFVNFFGRPAATTTLPALLHVRTGAPIVLLSIWRDGDRRFRVTLEEIEMPAQGDDEARVVAGTQMINDRMERVIRHRPEWWFWIHNRWKRSAEAAPGAAA